MLKKGSQVLSVGFATGQGTKAGRHLIIHAPPNASPGILLSIIKGPVLMKNWGWLVLVERLIQRTRQPHLDTDDRK